MVRQWSMFAAGLALGLAAAATGVAWGGQQADRETREAVSALKSRVVRAYVERDAAALDRIYAEDYTAIGADGSIRTKADELASVKKVGGDTLVEGRYDIVAVRRFGNVAVASGRGVLTWRTAEGPTRKSEYNSVNVFEYRDGRWLYVSAFLP